MSNPQPQAPEAPPAPTQRTNRVTFVLVDGQWTGEFTSLNGLPVNPRQFNQLQRAMTVAWRRQLQKYRLFQRTETEAPKESVQ